MMLREAVGREGNLILLVVVVGGWMTASWPHGGGDIHPGSACIMASWLNCLL